MQEYTVIEKNSVYYKYTVTAATPEDAKAVVAALEYEDADDSTWEHENTVVFGPDEVEE